MQLILKYQEYKNCQDIAYLKRKKTLTLVPASKVNMHRHIICIQTHNQKRPQNQTKSQSYSFNFRVTYANLELPYFYFQGRKSQFAHCTQSCRGNFKTTDNSKLIKLHLQGCRYGIWSNQLSYVLLQPSRSLKFTMFQSIFQSLYNCQNTIYLSLTCQST